jgi:hypothetical protein
VPQQKVGNRRDQTLLVGAGNQQNSGMSHRRALAILGGNPGWVFFAMITKIPLIALWRAGLAPGRAKIQQSLRSAGCMRLG